MLWQTGLRDSEKDTHPDLFLERVQHMSGYTMAKSDKLRPYSHIEHQRTSHSPSQHQSRACHPFSIPGCTVVYIPTKKERAVSREETILKAAMLGHSHGRVEGVGSPWKSH
jgi:hypothetical protein